MFLQNMSLFIKGFDTNQGEYSGEVEKVKCRLKEFLDGRPVTWLAKKSGVKRTTINNYINGGTPQLDKAYAIAKALGVTVYDIWPDE